VVRFTQEARAAASLSHPNIVVVFDSGSEAGMDDLVTEYVEARSASTGPTSRCRWEYDPPVRPRLMSGRTPLRIRHQRGQVADEVLVGRREHSILWSC
jgi:hypothetical protein